MRNRKVRMCQSIHVQLTKSDTPLDDPEAFVQELRRVVLWSLTQVTGTLMLICFALGLGPRALALEIAADGNYIYCRGTKGEYSASRLHWLPHTLVNDVCSTRAKNEKQNP